MPLRISSSFVRRRAIRRIIAATALTGCLLGTWSAGRAGLSRLRSRAVVREGLPAQADEAVRLGPSDPEAHYARASVLLDKGEIGDAIKEYERAVALRPKDYILWTALGIARGYNGDTEGALAAHREAVRLAPYYAHAYWYMGAYLLELRRQDEAFTELRRAVKSRPSLLSDTITLAWDTFGGDVQAVRGAIQPDTTRVRLALAKFLVQHENAGEAIKLFREAGGEVSAHQRSELLNELLGAKQFKEAYEIWSAGREAGGENSGGTSQITDGGFEDIIASNDPGFGWRPTRSLPAVRISLDDKEPRAGARSLRMEFSGDPGDSEFMSQLVLVEPNARYTLAFAARSEEMVTGGQPIITVTDDSSGEARKLAQSAPLPQGTHAWRDYAVEFTTSDQTRAIVVRFERQSCSSARCPIFGRIWFDDFSLQTTPHAAN